LITAVKVRISGAECQSLVRARIGMGLRTQGTRFRATAVAPAGRGDKEVLTLSWAHRTIYLTFDTDWRITYSDGQTIVGMQAILDYESSDGWELVAAVVEDRDEYGERDSAGAYRLFFKRPA
jgi:hypothetical protein